MHRKKYHCFTEAVFNWALPIQITHFFFFHSENDYMPANKKTVVKLWSGYKINEKKKNSVEQNVLVRLLLNRLKVYTYN